MLPRRLGARFALEALFLVLLALGAGLAHLRPLFIVGVMAGGWALVALAEANAARIDRSPVTYLLPEPREEEDEPEQVFGPRPEERTIVAPLEPEPEEERQPVEAAAPGEPVLEEPAGDEPAEPRRRRFLLPREPEPEEEPQPVEAAAPEEPVLEEPAGDEPEQPRRRRFLLPREPEPEEEPQPVEAAVPEEPVLEEPAGDEPEERRPRRRGFLRRREPEPEPEPPSPPRHVKLLPRRTAGGPSRASQEVAELFGETPDETKPGETGT